MTSRKPFERLPYHAVPQHYTIEITPNLKECTFAGKVTIELKIIECTNEIKFNSVELEFKTITLIDKDGEERTGCVCHDKENELVCLTYQNKIRCGDTKLIIEYTGVLNDRMMGFYRSKYSGTPPASGKYAAVTQFEPTSARQCFPCWDEPAIKATFDIMIVVPDKVLALSNMPAKEEIICCKRTMVFERTPKMSTYLIAIVVGEYDFIEAATDDGITVRVYTPLGKKELGQYALDNAIKFLCFYKEYFGIGYPLPKMDLIGISDFAAGAMENWGLITFREHYILLNPETASATAKQRVLYVIGHEIAHQWFGNLVTMEWWTHLWLNEGYASFVPNLAIDCIAPEFEVWAQFLAEHVSPALHLDAMKNSHPIEADVGHPDEIGEIFDAISYEKGASVLRMLHNFIGDEAFKKGMNAYLTKYQYGNTVTNNLWDALEEASGKPVRDAMTTWTRQMGFPLIVIEEKEAEEPNSRMFEIKQEKFSADGTKEDASKQIWYIPISVVTQRDPEKAEFITMMDTRVIPLMVPDIQCDDWVKLNPGMTDFYRVQYPAAMIEQFLPSIRMRTMDPADRVSILSDMFALAKSGRTPIVEVLQMLENYMGDDAYVVWDEIDRLIADMLSLTQHTGYHDKFKEFAKAIFSQVRNNIKWDPEEDEAHLCTLLRVTVIGRLANLGDQRIIKQAKKKFQEKQRGTSIDTTTDLNMAMYTAVMSEADEDTLDRFFNLYKKEKEAMEKNRILASMGAAPTEELLQKVLDFTMSDDVRSQDRIFAFRGVSRTQMGRTLAWKFFKENRQKLLDMYAGTHLLSFIVEDIISGFSCPNKGKQIEKFFSENPVPGVENVLSQALEQIKTTSEWLHRDYKVIEEFLDQLKICSCQAPGTEPKECTCEFDGLDYKCKCKPEED